MANSVRSRTIRNTAQARVSVPSYLKPVSGSEASSFTTSASASTSTTTSALPASTQSAIAAESIPTLHPSLLLSSSSPPKQPPQPRDHAQKYTWTTNLPSTSPFWPGWFEGLSSKFLSARGGKLLILAGTDRLDKELMVGQMQGIFPRSLFPKSSLGPSSLFLSQQPRPTLATAQRAWNGMNERRLALTISDREIPALHLPRLRSFRAGRSAGEDGADAS